MTCEDAGTRPQMLAAFDQVVAEAESSGAVTAVLVSHGAAIAAPAASSGGAENPPGPSSKVRLSKRCCGPTRV